MRICRFNFNKLQSKWKYKSDSHRFAFFLAFPLFFFNFFSKKKNLFQQGLFTSPHLVAVRERIRLDGSKISEEKFTKYFFECWDKLSANTKVKESL